jgi:hypothetical protein
MSEKTFPKSQLPVRKTVELLPQTFQTPANKKFMEAVVDPLVQPGVLEKVVGYIGRRYGKTYRGSDVYLDSDQTLRSRYQLEPGIIVQNNDKVESFYDYLDFKNQLKFFGNTEENDSLTTDQTHYSWNPPIDWDKFINYREYYWIPNGPLSVPVTGQTPEVVRYYRVSLGTQSSYIFNPDGFTNNPTLRLFRGQRYEFKVNAPGQGFYIRSSYDTGSLRFNPNKAYTVGSLIVYDDKIWKALKDLPPGNASNIFEGSADWQLVDVATEQSPLDYNRGVTNNGTQNGTVIFDVPFDAPDILYYQSAVDPDRFGKFLIADIEENSTIDVEQEIVGSEQYTSGNGIKFTNGLIVEFRGRVAPEKYSKGVWLVEGVGSSINLINFDDLVIPPIKTETPTVLFDNSGFDTEPFDDASSYPGTKDYITINRRSIDSNPWSRYNRWFHKSVLEYSYKIRGQEFSSPENLRAKRPIIEFSPNLQLFNHGTVAKQSVDLIEDYTTDVFSIIEGSTGYVVDGETLFNGARLLVISDTDTWANGKIYRVEFIQQNNRRQIALREEPDTDPVEGQCVLVKRGKRNKGLMYHYTNGKWVKSQVKETVNQPPLFDIFDEEETSFADVNKYPVNSFKGCELVSYKIGNGPVDSELGISLSYLNIDNVGDIEFSWKFGLDTFQYTQDQRLVTQKISQGYYKFVNGEYSNGWINTDNQFIQPIIDSVKIVEDTNRIELTSINWDLDPDFKISIYINNQRYYGTYIREGNDFIFPSSFKKNDIVYVKIITDQEPVTGYYEIPVGLEKNPLNQELETFTLGQSVDHIISAVEFDDEFQGVVPGNSNLRDTNEYRKHAKRFLKHGAIAPLAISLLCDKNVNVIKSLQYTKKAYTDFKSNFLNRAVELDFDSNIADFVDSIMADLTKTKTVNDPFSDADMIGTGAYTAIRYKVDDEGIKTFALSERFTLTEVSRRAVYVYVNEQQLLHAKEYTFNDTFGFITVLIDVEEGDEIEIREYVNTSACFIPPTPTSLGLYKKYTPKKFIDDTYREPREVIQGHDGSITFAYGDFRDDVLLELEYRIYNNIKEEYREDLFDIDAVIGGYYGNAEFNKKQVDDIVVQEFLKWIQNTDINYTLNTYFKETETFTYTYSNMTDPANTVNLPGWWRGVYQWFYDTDRPHRCPWEMLGFSEQPDWWEDEYGAAPYTSNNLILWEDLQEGIIRQGPRAGQYKRYQRPGLLNHIPVDGDGILLSPLDSNLAGNFVLINNKGDFKLGDVSPVEYAWRSSSEWPYAVMIALTLLKPFEFISTNFDRTKLTVNKLGQTIGISSRTFLTLDVFDLPNLSNPPSVGLISYLVNYAKSRRSSLDVVENKIKNLDVRLSSRLSGFVDKEQQKYLLDSKNPRSSSSSIFVPPENYDIIFNVSSPISTISYSGVILEKSEGGWVVSGYDSLRPYFEYYEAVPGQKDPLITVGGISEKFVDWAPEKLFNNGQLVKYKNDFYRCLKTHTSDVNFDPSLWKRIPAVPLVGGVEALYRKNFNRLYTKRISYGTKLFTIQAVVDFLLGYEKFLESQGITFNGYDSENQVAQNWLTGCKEFMFWTKHNWALGSLITLSPAASKIDIDIPVGVADNLLDSFYDYQVFKSDGNVLDTRFINVDRTFQKITVETTNTTDGIYFLRINYVLKEHVVIFTDRTVFNDVIYDKTTGYRQERVKTQGFRTVDWDGDYTSPGFLFDNVDIQEWQPFRDYRLGDIVAYQSRFWTSQENQLGVETFDNTKWSRLDSTPEKQLVPNFDYKINLFDDFYDVTAEGLGQSQRSLARHSLGYQERKYLQDMAEDPITQFQIYQGFIREKGTINSIVKVFDKLSRSGSGGVTLSEEWAFRVGRFGGIDQLKEIEFQLRKDKFVLDPQPIIVDENIFSNADDQFYRISKRDFTITGDVYDSRPNPTSYDSSPIKTAGYVRLDQVDFSVRTRDDILDLDIFQFVDNESVWHLWITFDFNPESLNKFSKNLTWTVLRIERHPELLVTDVSVQAPEEEVDPTQKTVLISFAREHGLETDDLIGIKKVENLNGFYVLEKVSNTVISIKLDRNDQNPELFDDSSIIPEVFLFSEARFDSYRVLDETTSAALKNGSKLWIDNDGSDHWEVFEKQKQFSSIVTDLYAGLEDSFNTENHAELIGYKVLYDKQTQQLLVSIPNPGYVLGYTLGTNTAGDESLVVKSIMQPPLSVKDNLLSIDRLEDSFGKVMALSPDSRWLAISAPEASQVPSRFTKDYITTTSVTNILPGKLYRIKELGNTDFTDTTFTDLVTRDPTQLIIGKEYIITLVGTTSWATLGADGSQPITVGTRFVATATATSNPGSAGRAIEAVFRGKKAGIGTGIVSIFYEAGEIVLQNGKLWESVISHNAEEEGDIISFNSTIWKPTKLIPVVDEFFKTNPGYENQGVVFLYEKQGLRWDLRSSFISPRPADGEFFGSALSIGYDEVEEKYRLAVSAKGSLSERGRVYLFEGLQQPGQEFQWQHLDNENYVGIYLNDPLIFYFRDSVVWYDDRLWKALEDISGDVVPSAESGSWEEIDPIITQNSLPQFLAFEDDDSTLPVGLLDSTQVIENVVPGDQFGYSITMNQDATILVVGSPNSSAEYFENYKGIWKEEIIYRTDEVVKYNGVYYRLTKSSSQGVIPETVVDNSWIPLETSVDATGKVYVYKLTNIGYKLIQTLSPETLYIDDSTGVFTGDLFGYNVTLNRDGSVLTISSPKANFEEDDQGAVYILHASDLDNLNYIVDQRITSFEDLPNEFFGHDVSLSESGNTLVIAAKDSVRTEEDFVGSVYVFEKKDLHYFLTEKLETTTSPEEIFGFSIVSTDDVIGVGSLNYRKPTLDNNTGETTYGPYTGAARLFVKEPGISSWKILAEQSESVDISKVRSIELYDNKNNLKIADVDYVDHAKLKILNIAEQEITFKTSYDPAVYSVVPEISNDENVAWTGDPDTAWTTVHVGELWWNLSTVKWLEYEQGDTAFRSGNWNVLAPGATVDVYEWVETPLLPSEWSALADTNEGLAEGISGQPLYPNDDVYSIKELLNEYTGEPTSTLYYYWVKNTAVIPMNVTGRRASAKDVASFIRDPKSSGIPFIALIDKDQYLAYNFASSLVNDSTVLNIQYYKDKIDINVIHNEYQLLTEGIADSLPALSLETKWIDSLIGYDAVGNSVPDTKLPAKQKYGVGFRPRQSIFVNRQEALKIAIKNINEVLSRDSFADFISFENLNKVDLEPVVELNLYDVQVDQDIDLQNILTSRIKQAVLTPNIINGQIDSVEITNPGFGYKVPPIVTIDGDGTKAKIETEIDLQGRVTKATVSNRGKRYSFANIKVREFSVLVRRDETLGGFWSIYSWDEVRKIFFRSKNQAFDTTRYWNLVDWWREGYTPASRIVKEISTVAVEPTIKTQLGDLIRVKEYGSGGWAVFEKVSDDGDGFLSKFKIVGRKDGTIKLSESLYDGDILGIGYDNARSFDIGNYDLENFRELRNILKSVKEDIFIGDYFVEWNKLFFSSIRYAFSEQRYIDWAFKTSFLNATHNVGSLEQKLNYKNDNLRSFQDYIDEVKPYRTTIREYVSRYQNIDDTKTSVTDFDLPAVYSEVDGKIIPITDKNDFINSNPWKWWRDNVGYSVVDIKVFNGGEGYVQRPKVIIEGNGTGATAEAYISNGSVSTIQITNIGKGYTNTPTIRIVGGNGDSTNIAKAVAILGETKIRNFKLISKFDRITKTGKFVQLSNFEEFIASGSETVFNLSYPISGNKSDVEVFRNNQLVLTDEYSITSYQIIIDNTTYRRGKIIFVAPPQKDDVVSIVYEKDDSILDSVNRIQKHYAPISGMKGNDLNQLMTGIDFGGVQVQGSTFDVTGGWDTLPWFTDSWDSVEPSSDFYFVAGDNQQTVRLPYVPAENQLITIYIQRKDPNNPDRLLTAIRLDDVNYVGEDDSTSFIANPNAIMPTFKGDGFTDEINIGDYIQTVQGEVLIFRPIESDGTVNITDTNILDTNITGGSLNSIMGGAYITASGMLPEEILVEGGSLTSPDFVPAPEENIPGQVLESLCFKVFHKDPETQDVSGFEIHKDMLNLYYYKRFSYAGFKLAKDLNYYDRTIVLVDAAGLFNPADNNNSAGMIYINGEKIEYLSKNGNVLEQLRRGSQGTAVSEKHLAGSTIADVSVNQSIPYTDTQIRTDVTYEEILTFDGQNYEFEVSDLRFVGNGNKSDIQLKLIKSDTIIDESLYSIAINNGSGVITLSENIEIEESDTILVSTLLVGPLEFIPMVDENTVIDGNTWFRNNGKIPENYGQCNEIEVFVGGRRLRKSPTEKYNENIAADSPDADEMYEAEFSVTPGAPYVRLTDHVGMSGIRVTIIKRTGNLWYERGQEVASAGVTLLENDTPVARFIAQKTTDLPE